MEYLYLFMKNFKYSGKEDVRSASFIYNSNILVGRQVINDKVLINNNITFIHQLINGEHFFTHQQFTAKYHIKINYLRYHSITLAVRAYILRLDVVEQTKIKIKNFQPIFETLISIKKCSQIVYQKMLDRKSNITGFEKWKIKLGISEFATGWNPSKH